MQINSQWPHPIVLILCSAQITWSYWNEFELYNRKLGENHLINHWKLLTKADFWIELDLHTKNVNSRIPNSAL